MERTKIKRETKVIKKEIKKAEMQLYSLFGVSDEEYSGFQKAILMRDLGKRDYPWLELDHSF